jgi:hypothetical protein
MTVHRYLEKQGFKKAKSVLKPPLHERQIQARLKFAKTWLVGGKDTLGNVIWSDETRVASNPSNRVLFHWTTSNKKFVKEKMHSEGNSVTFWGCLSKYGVGPLVSLNQTMDSERYIKILQARMPSKPRILFSSGNLGTRVSMCEQKLPLQNSFTASSAFSASK